VGSVFSEKTGLTTKIFLFENYRQRDEIFAAKRSARKTMAKLSQFGWKKKHRRRRPDRDSEQTALARPSGEGAVPTASRDGAHANPVTLPAHGHGANLVWLLRTHYLVTVVLKWLNIVPGLLLKT
jgi:hypothetical protein